METISTFIPWIQLALSALIIGVVLIQQSESGMSGNMGGGQPRVKRGLEKGLFIATIVIAILFAASALLAVYLKNF